MKNIIDIYEASLLDIDSTIDYGSKYISAKNKIEKILKTTYNYIDFIEKEVINKYKKHKRPTSKTDNYYEIKDFDVNKKYFIFTKQGYWSSDRPDLHVFYELHINEIYDIHKSYIYMTGEVVKIEKFNYEQSSISDHIKYEGKNRILVYEVPKELEWLYDYIKKLKL